MRPTEYLVGEEASEFSILGASSRGGMADVYRAVRALTADAPDGIKNAERSGEDAIHTSQSRAAVK